MSCKPRLLVTITAVFILSMAAFTACSRTDGPTERVGETAHSPTEVASAPSTPVTGMTSGAQSSPTPIPTAPAATATSTALNTDGLTTEPTPVPLATFAPERQVEAPLRLEIPSIGIDTTIEWVGLDADGNMAVPSTYQTVGWYENGPRPGMRGKAVIAGHLDSKTGPAVFYRLDQLAVGDDIVVVTHAGEELHFAVDGVETFDAGSAPSYDIFGPATSAELNLVTCEGSFDQSAHAYNQRLVVYSTLAAS